LEGVAGKAREALVIQGMLRALPRPTASSVRVSLCSTGRPFAVAPEEAGSTAMMRKA
jgi:hypothetical protein